MVRRRNRHPGPDGRPKSVKVSGYGTIRKYPGHRTKLIVDVAGHSRRKPKRGRRSRKK